MAWLPDSASLPSEPLFAAQVGQRLRMGSRRVCAESSQEAFWPLAAEQ